MAEMTAKGDILDLIGRDVTLERVASTHGGEFAGGCPFCGDGHDRLRVWPVRGRFWCRVCGECGDSIHYKVARGEMTPAEAGRLRRAADGLQGGSGQGAQGKAQRSVAPPRRADLLAPPGPAWQRCARAFCDYATEQLWQTPEALDYLRGRGLSEETIRASELGWNPRDWWRDPAKWGLTHARKKVWLPTGWTIPWSLGGVLWRVNVRTPDGRPKGTPKYCGPAGFANALYNADALAAGQPAIVVEGELDALTISQVAGDVVAPVATGSTGNARRALWVARLAVCSSVLVAFDADAAGEKAASWWLGVLSRARRWRPLWDDASGMLEEGADVRAWVLAGLGGGAAALPGDVAPEAEALALLDRMATDPEAVRRYAALAEQEGWPCDGAVSWGEWAARVELDVK